MDKIKNKNKMGKKLEIKTKQEENIRRHTAKNKEKFNTTKPYINSQWGRCYRNHDRNDYITAKKKSKLLVQKSVRILFFLSSKVTVQLFQSREKR